MAAEASETTPQVLADVISLTGTVIPAAVIATWTQAERDDALAWAAAEHLSASDNEGVERVPQPLFVHRAAEVCASPAMAQVAVDSWITCKEMVRVPGLTGDPAESAIAGAQMAITGLLVLLGSEAGASWQRKALEVIGRYPAGGVEAVDLMAMLGRDGPAREDLDAWLAAGQERGVLECSPAAGTWRAAGPGASGAVRRTRP